MRITCPNCDAIYEIDAELIPPEGRDVQCSACGRVWIQTRDGRREAAPDGTTDEPGGAPAATAPTASDAAEADEDGDDALIDVGPEAPRRRPDEDTLRILREEAAREAAKRRSGRAEPPADPEARAEPVAPADPEPPAEPSAPAVPPRGSAVPSRPDRDEAPRPAASGRVPTPSRPDRDEAPPVAERRAGRPAERRSDSGGDLLPDLDEINSTLSGPARSRDDAPEPAPAERGRFVSGFIAILLIACAVVAVYYAAPWIAGRVPAAEAPLATYVEAVNAVRTWSLAWLDSFAQGIAALGG